jgi:hypothetical protein
VEKRRSLRDLAEVAYSLSGSANEKATRAVVKASQVEQLIERLATLEARVEVVLPKILARLGRIENDLAALGVREFRPDLGLGSGVGRPGRAGL